MFWVSLFLIVTDFKLLLNDIIWYMSECIPDLETCWIKATISKMYPNRKWKNQAKGQNEWQTGGAIFRTWISHLAKWNYWRFGMMLHLSVLKLLLDVSSWQPVLLFKHVLSSLFCVTKGAFRPKRTKTDCEDHRHQNQANF